MPVEVKVAKAHEAELRDPEILMEYQSVGQALQDVQIPFADNAVNFVFVKGYYCHAERKMVTACLFVNKLDKPIRELHGVLRLKFQEKSALIAKTTVNFDEAFMGVVKPNQALLVHLGIPVKGLTEDETFSARNIAGEFTDVRISYTE